MRLKRVLYWIGLGGVLAVGLFGGLRTLGSVHFDGTDDDISLGDVSFLDSVQQFTIGGWFKRDAGGVWCGLGKHTDVDNRVTLAAWDDGNWYVSISNGGNNYAVVTANNDTSWHHVVFRYDGTEAASADRGRAWFDGVEQTLSWAGTIATSTANHTQNFTVGSHYFNLQRYSDGVITEVFCYTNALTPAQIVQLYNGRMKGMPTQVSPSTLAVYLPMDQFPDGTNCDGLTFRDRGGQGHNGTGSDGANDSGCAMEGETFLSYPAGIGE